MVLLHCDVRENRRRGGVQTDIHTKGRCSFIHSRLFVMGIRTVFDARTLFPGWYYYTVMYGKTVEGGGGVQTDIHTKGRCSFIHSRLFVMGIRTVFDAHTLFPGWYYYTVMYGKRYNKFKEA